MASYPARRSRRHRSAGEGSVYESADGWRGAITWTGADGTRHRRTVRGKSSADARAKLDALRDQLRTGGLEHAQTGTVGVYLPAWLEREKQRIRPSTWRQREQYVRCYLIPALGKRPLVKLTPADVERMTAGLIASGKAPRTAAHARVILRRALGDAMRDGLLHRNVAALARAPRVSGRTIQPGRDYLDTEQLRRLLAVAAEYRVGALVTVAATTGLRQGELRGLTWDDVDWTRGTLTVRRSLARAWDGGYQLAEPKTGRSRRTVNLPAAAIDALRREQREQSAAREAVGIAWQDRLGLIFTDAVGRPLYPTAVHRAFRELLTAAGLAFVPFHGLRHSTATALLAAGVPLRVVSDVLGHSGIAITADYYAHVERDARREAADAMDRALGGER
jgi:integrase